MSAVQPDLGRLIVAAAMLIWRAVGMPAAPADAKTEVAAH